MLKRSRWLLAIMFFWSLRIGPACALGAPAYDFRDDIMLVTLNQMEAREGAIREAMQEASLLQVSIRKSREDKRLARLFLNAGSWMSKFSQVHPYVLDTITWSDNTYTTESDRRSRISYANTLGAKTSYNAKGKSVVLDMNFEDNRDPQGEMLRTSNQLASFSGTVTLPLGRFNLGLYDGVTTNYVSIDEFDRKPDTLEYKWTNNFNAVLGRNYNRIGFDLSYTRSDDMYSNKFKRDNDAVGQDFGISSYLRIGRKTRLEYSYDYVTNHYKDTTTTSEDSFSHVYSAALSGVLTPKISAAINAGYSLASTVNGENTRTTSIGSSLAYAADTRTDVSLTTSHLIGESSVKSDYSLIDSFALSANHRLAFNQKINISGTGGMSFSKSPKAAITDKTHTYNYGFGIAYSFRQWWDLSLNYAYTDSFSRVDSDYDENLITFASQARF